RSNDQGKADSEAHGRLGIAVDKSGHMIELLLTKQEHVAARGEKSVNAAKQAGDVWGRFAGRRRSSREAEKTSGRRVGFTQFIPNLLNTGSQQSRMNLRVRRVDVTKVAGRKHDGFLVDGLIRGNGGALGWEKYSFSESRRHQVGQEGTTVPSLECRPANIDGIDFDARLDDP